MAAGRGAQDAVLAVAARFVTEAERRCSVIGPHEVVQRRTMVHAGSKGRSINCYFR